jgi:hypothetical protein
MSMLISTQKRLISWTWSGNITKDEEDDLRKIDMKFDPASYSTEGAEKPWRTHQLKVDNKWYKVPLYRSSHFT